MRKIYFLIILFIFQLKIFGQQDADGEFNRATSHWFSAWTLVYKDIYKINTLQPVQFVFFDEKYIYSTSSISVGNGESINGPTLLNLKLSWKRALHHDTLTLPDRTKVPVGILSFASEIPDSNHQSFFVMPLPGFWKKAGIQSKELGLDNLITGVFIHEFSHSQQMESFGTKITQYEKKNNFGTEFSDDIVQNIFSKNSEYTDLYNYEVNSFYNSISDGKLNKKEVLKGLNFMERRQKNYFKNQYRSLSEIDDLFLTMEGLGQYSMYLWLIDPKGGKIDKNIAIEGVRRNKKWWSQDEGFALFLILERLRKPGTWAKTMFGTKTATVTELIHSNLR
ncbi:hypothetical protein C1631_013520 [Chryseobacterium phosphatilyticum]|uniref:Uncharacterized protein n=1 Tax=Chryseobacterium phosphatilyticum TaxID=475075 RepID=A0A316X5K9_9FLAO|nr:hypothetical protein [Chryseobacterium phosphatilyticum]PWN69081.1 hypothetical protein C1631_013520 [Chryseobacterium phosphatilyticum]